jgi:hypothetical protein
VVPRTKAVFVGLTPTATQVLTDGQAMAIRPDPVGGVETVQLDPESLVMRTPASSMAKQTDGDGQARPVTAPVPAGKVSFLQLVPPSVVTRTSPADELLVPAA